ncbi:hypothetical protein BD560DRAFT_406253 [Blakeslea trispora]|nr:hypothetical protein BD560DRAFT_406253 [Blakeslea trispora]
MSSVTNTIRKRSLSIENDEEQRKKRPRENDQLFDDLTHILEQIRSTPSTGEISADLLNSFRVLMLQIESMSLDRSNTEAKDMRDQTDRYLDAWFQELIVECFSENEDDLISQEVNLTCHQTNDDEDDDIALALALQDEEDYCKDISSEEICSKVRGGHDENEDVEIEIV